MIRLFRRGIVLYTAVFSFWLCTATCFAERSLEETKLLLQKSLTVTQIDQEVTRLTDEQTRVSSRIGDTNVRLAAQDELVKQKREHAGKVLRAYYMGERDSLWLLVFSAGSFSDMIAVYEFLSMIFENDRLTLSAYQEAYDQLRGTKLELDRTMAELQQVKDEFLKQRERAVALQAEVERELKDNPDAARQVEALRSEWQEKGIPMFEKYFRALASNMWQLPVDQHIDLVKRKFAITDGQFGDFLKQRDPMFNNVTFRFEGGQFNVTGRDDGIDMSIKGSYTVENDPDNRLQFHVNELGFNGYTLDYTFNRTLEQKFNLGFSPQSFVEGIGLVKELKATAVSIEDGSLSISLYIKL